MIGTLFCVQESRIVVHQQAAQAAARQDQQLVGAEAGGALRLGQQCPQQRLAEAGAAIDH